MGYGLLRAWRYVPCAAGQHKRRVRVYLLAYRPANQPGLF